MFFADFLDSNCGTSIDVSFDEQLRIMATSAYYYEPNMDCNVTLRAPVGDNLKLKFKKLDIYPSDKLSLYHGSSKSNDLITGNVM